MNIVVITPIFPEKHEKLTKVVNSFCEEWSKENTVQVFHVYSNYPSWLEFILLKLNDVILNLRGHPLYLYSNAIKSQIINKNLTKNLIGFNKKYPTEFISPKKAFEISSQIIDILSLKKNVPDIIIGHWINPSILIVENLKKKYPSSKTAITVHVDPMRLKKEYKLLISKKIFNNFNYVGFRSKKFIHNFPLNIKTHLCPSGIPDYFFSTIDKKFNKKMKICYVGHLVKRKFPVSIIKALSLLEDNKFHSVSFFGDGPQKSKLIKLNDFRYNIIFNGQVSREKLPFELDKHDIFVMISKKEAFGLVYLEAMSRGLITIAAKNEGIDGIIVNGENGFLVEAGNHVQLSKILKHILSMTENQKIKISQNAINTSKRFSDTNVSNNYLKNIQNA